MALALAPCVVPKIVNGTVWPKGHGNATEEQAVDADGQTVPHGEQLVVRCEPRYEFLNNGTPVLCNNGTWTQIPKCQPGGAASVTLLCRVPLQL